MLEYDKAPFKRWVSSDDVPPLLLDEYWKRRTKNKENDCETFKG